MKVEGDAAKEFDAVRLDSCESVNQGVLKMADDQTGAVVWLDRTGEERSIALGQGTIRIIPINKLSR